MFHSDEPRLPRTDVCGSKFEVGTPNSEEEVEKKKSLPRRTTKSPITAVLESCLISILHFRFLFKSVVNFRVFAADPETISRVSGNGDVSTGVETDGQLRGRNIFVTRRLVPLASGPQHDVPEAVHTRSRSRELLEQAFDYGKICVQMRNIQVLFLVGSKFFLPHLCLLDHFVTDPTASVIRATGNQMLSLFRSVCEEEKAQLLSPLMNS